MHHFPLAGRRLTRSLLVLVALLVGVGASLLAQIPGKNVNMVAGTEWPGGDPFLQRQNEPSIAASTRNPLHLVAGSNDYRTVDLPGLPDDVETGDAWVSVYKSFDGGQRWSSTLMPGYPQDTSAAGMASPLRAYKAAADPVVRAGTHGLIYYNGLAFNRGTGGTSGIFLSRFIDRNNKENGDPVAFLGTSMVVTSDGTTFLDKPWMAVDMPRGSGAMCVVGGVATGGRVKRNGHRKRGNGRGHDDDDGPWLDPGLQYVPAGAVYVAYTAITGDGATLQSQIFVKRSMDCGATWSAPMRVSSTADAINQGATLAISPSTGDLFVAWRRFSTPTVADLDAVMVARLRINGNSFEAPGKARGLRRTGPDSEAAEKIFEHRQRRATPTVAASVSQIDQGTSPYRFRTNAYPTMTVDGAGRAYVAWSERGFATARPDPTDGDARILVSTTLDGRTFTAPVVADNSPSVPGSTQLVGHQLMPSLAFSGGKLMLVFYDLRETRANAFGKFVDDSLSTNGKRQTIEIRASLGTPGGAPVFAPSVRVSDYLTGYRGRGTLLEQLQVNPPNLPMFKQGTVPFIGDYIDVAPSPAFVPTATGDWAYNIAASAQLPVFHTAWTDNRDVRPPIDGNWANYTPPGLAGGLPSLFDPTKIAPVCVAGNAGSRNQNIYTARISGGLLVGSPGNAKQLSPTVQRGFVVFAQNQTTLTKTFRMTLLAQPPGGRASFEQFPLPGQPLPWPAPKTSVDVRVPPRSTASRTVYATSTDPKASLSIDVSEISAVAGGVVPGGLAGRVVLNPDIENPDIENPDIENPDIENPDIENAEVYNPDIENPDIENPDIENPDIENPDIENPDIENRNVANPDIENLTIGNPDIENPDIENPDIENPNVSNPDIENGAIADVTWTVSNIGNTSSAFNVNLFLASAGLPPSCSPSPVPGCIDAQLIVYKTYKTPVVSTDGCSVKVETRNIVLYNVPNPNFIRPGQGLPDQNDPADTNATLWLNPGELGRVTLRVYDKDTSNNVIVRNLDGSTASIDPRFNPATVVTAAISAQGVDVLDPPGATEPPAVTTTGTNLFFLQQPTNVAPAALIAPPVIVRVWDNTGAPLSGVQVNIALDSPPAGVLLSGSTSTLSDVNGVATFATLSVNIPATGLRLRAVVPTASPTVFLAAGSSAPFDVLSSPGAVAIENPGFEILYKAGSTTVTALPFSSFTAIGGNSNLGMTGDSRQFSDASFGTSYDLPGWTFSTLMGVAYLGEAVLGPGHGNVAWFNGPNFGGGTAGKSMSQVLGENLQQGLTYTLTADFGWRADNGIATTPPVLNLYAGGTLLVPTLQISPALVQGTLVTYSRTYLVNNPSISGPLKVEVGLGPNTVGQQLNVDNVTLQKALNTPGTVTITDFASVFDGSPKPVTVTTSPLGLAVSVFYNGNQTVPSAIGAYLAQAMITQPGFGGSGSVIKTIASTLSAGGPGGGPYPASGALSCGPGVFANGLRAAVTGPPNEVFGYIDYALTSGQLLCSNAVHPVKFGGGTTPNVDLVCPAGQIMVGFWGTTSAPYGPGAVMGSVSPRCQLPTGGPITNGPGPLPAAGGVPFDPIECPLGQAVTGVVGGQGAVVDSMALVCAPLPTVAGTITSVSPSSTAAVGAGQMLTLNGSALPIAGSTAGSFPRERELQVVLTQGGIDRAADFTWGGSATQWIIRLSPALAPGAATVRLTNPAATVTTNAFPITISNTPATPLLTSLRVSCGGAPITNLLPGGPFGVEADGIDTFASTLVWTGLTGVGAGTVLNQTSLTATASSTGGVCVFPASGAPTLSVGTWNLQIRTQVGAFPSALSNAIVVTVP